ncbi:hypothetical protein L585_15830 [Pantoea ananatis BRT175]|jgi:hypothetical protein|nr:hypothetical protein L585_15830 [Pantoea ananatis BRT175]
MGAEFHITRAKFWAENDDNQIASDSAEAECQGDR